MRLVLKLIVGPTRLTFAQAGTSLPSLVTSTAGWSWLACPLDSWPPPGRSPA
jgi:hypothetical protein